MQEFKMPREAIRKIQNRTLFRMIPLMLLTITVGLTISVVASDDPEGMIAVLPTIGIALLFIFPVALYISRKSTAKILASYTIRLSDNVITREQFGTPDLSLYFNEIRAIEKTKNGLQVYGTETNSIIAISKYIDQFDEIAARLTAFMPLSEKPLTPLLFRRQWPFAILVLLLMLGSFAGPNRTVIVISSISFIGIMLWSVCKIQTDKNTPDQYRRMSWLVLLPVISVAVRLVLLLAGVIVPH